MDELQFLMNRLLKGAEKNGRLRGAIQAFLIEWEVTGPDAPPPLLARTIQRLREVFRETDPTRQANEKA